jgi:hypothetical protein
MTGTETDSHVTYQSQVLFDPHIVMEIFFFADMVADGNGAGPTEVELRH